MSKFVVNNQRILTLDFPCNKFQKLPNLVTLYLRNEIAGGRESGFVRARQAVGRIVGCRIFRDFRQGEHQRQSKMFDSAFTRSYCIQCISYTFSTLFTYCSYEQQNVPTFDHVCFWSW